MLSGRRRQLLVAPRATLRRLLVDLDQLRDVELGRRLRLLADRLAYSDVYRMSFIGGRINLTTV